MIELIKLLLDNEFYKENKNKILKEMFASNLFDLYSLICKTQEKHQRDLSVEEIKTLYKVTYPTTTVAKLEVINQVLDNLPSIGKDVGKEVLEKARIVELGRKIAEVGIQITNGKTQSFEKAASLIKEIEQGGTFERDDFQPVSAELEDILSAINITTRWNFNLRDLYTVASGIGPGIFSIVFARVEAGKTAFWISICAGPDGFADQGARINCYCNEESAQRTQGRAVMSYTGMPLLELINNVEDAKKIYSRIKEKIKFYECKGKSIAEINSHIASTRPDIVVIDQLDKLSIDGTFSRRDEMLGYLYQEARNSGTRNECAVIAISQANAEGEGKNFLSSANLADSRTSKSAEGDIVIGIGKGIQHTDNQRLLNIIKNKVTGRHDDVVCLIQPEISRYIS